LTGGGEASNQLDSAQPESIAATSVPANILAIHRGIN
jgi:hypothetical protein